MFGALLGLAGSLFGGISQRRQTREQNANNKEMQEIQNQYNTEAALLERQNSIEDIGMAMTRARESAESAGFNPLTSMGFAGANASPSAGVGQKGAVAKLASPSIIGNVVSGLSDVVTSIEAQDAQEKRATDQLKKVQTEKNLGRAPKAATVYAKTKAVTAASKIPKAAGVATLGAPPARPYDNTTPSIPKIKDGELMRTNAAPVGPLGQAYIDPRMPDAEHSEQRYGDMAQEVGGIANLVRDNYYNDRLQKVATQFGRPVSDEIDQKIRQDLTLDVNKVIEETTRKFPSKGVRPPSSKRQRSDKKKKDEQLVQDLWNS